MLTIAFLHNIVYNTAAKALSFIDEEPASKSKYLSEKAALLWLRDKVGMWDFLSLFHRTDVALQNILGRVGGIDD